MVSTIGAYDGRVNYGEVEKAIRELVAAADEDCRRRFGAATVVRLTSGDELVEVAEAEFDDDARQAFAEACADPAGSSGTQLRQWLDRIDEGTVSDGGMEPRVLFALQALEHWAAHLVNGNPGPLAELAILSLEEVDHQYPTNSDDFLATPETAAEFDRIAASLRRP